MWHVTVECTDVYMSVNYDWRSVFLFLELEAQFRVRKRQRCCSCSCCMWRYIGVMLLCLSLLHYKLWQQHLIVVRRKALAQRVDRRAGNVEFCFAFVCVSSAVYQRSADLLCRASVQEHEGRWNRWQQSDSGDRYTLGGSYLSPSHGNRESFRSEKLLRST